METGSYLFQAFLDTPWFLSLSKLQQIEAVMSNKFLRNADMEELKAQFGAVATTFKRTVDRELGYEKIGSKAIVPVHGTLIKRAGFLDAASGISSYASIENGIKNALNDPMVNH